jgi:NAD(P)-dependent dehydrogenase (short-subunit alcohol dehydrogenase family)
MTPALVDSAKKADLSMEKLEEQRKTCTILGRIGKPEEVANGILFFASEKASYITGTHLIIDGGYTVL